MKLFRHIAVTALLTIGVFGAVTYTACTKDKCKDVTCLNGGTCSGGNCTCVTGVSGSRCDTLLKAFYAGTYKGTGSDNTGYTYSNWNVIVAPTSSATDLTGISFLIADNNLAPIANLSASLATNTTYNINSTTTALNDSSYTFTGNGTINGTTLTANITQTTVGSGYHVLITFNSMTKQ